MNRTAYIERIAAQLTEWDAEVEKLEDHARRQREQGRVLLRRRIQQMRSRRGVAETKLQQIRNASDGEWEGLRQEVDRAIREMKSTLHAAKAKPKSS